MMSPGNSCNGRGLSAGSLHERATVHLFGGVLVVGSAQQPYVLCPVDVRSRKTVHVIEFEGSHGYAARAQRVQDARQASRRAGDGNSLGGNILREPILADAEREHRGKTDHRGTACAPRSLQGAQGRLPRCVTCPMQTIAVGSEAWRSRQSVLRRAAPRQITWAADA